ncbi:hypothetical protein A6M27_02745 [Acidithiobacillus thiooxidans]|uniref:Uncharacterized protein n=1 Tax=Acidithiobacillus thiooxidans TaxID=930 RepID=A0A1C2IJV9_ACITH|nr:hypothetical protein [Acidithiobacillus thiooxidans]OCX72297.1 hypothetical protein A6O24_14245 [Acidithiobacillus thiooxidans]OCX76262.1 hypothetical protein A6P07_02905 [Acidithiobacillus thiooxidans]OCX78486.1 hypothetical protein A6O26_18055 [Acidithiobacillus thiooxidans]OCX89267.1 hypothetical protein A6M27_02745 [Acidithiobacillus thiooxidans]OFC42618.1 hypothetical protein BAE47_14815 [Acidithiobacillus thiooxidans]
MSKPIFANIKLVGQFAERIEREAAERKVTKTALITDYVFRGLSTSEGGSTELDGFEKRIAATMLAVRGDVEAVQAELDTFIAMFDLFVKLMLLHLPEPAQAESEAVQSSALTRYDQFIQQVAEGGFDGDRPRAIAKIARLLTQKLNTEES